MTSTPTPGQTAVSAVLAAIPTVGGVLQVVYADTMARRAARAQDWAEGLAGGLSEGDVEDLEDLFAHDERLQDMLLVGLEAAMRSRVQAQRRALGAILGATIRD